MCLGDEARVANENARRQYRYLEAKRKRIFIQESTLHRQRTSQYKESLDNIARGVSDLGYQLQTQVSRVEERGARENVSTMIKQMSESFASSRAASGVSGKSVQRMRQLERVQLAQVYAARNAALTDAKEDFKFSADQGRRQAKNAQMQEFAKVWNIPVPGVETPKPVMQNVALAAFKDALGIASSIIGIASGAGALGGAGVAGATGASAFSAGANIGGGALVGGGTFASGIGLL